MDDNSTGLSHMDIRMSDERVVPELRSIKRGGGMRGSQKIVEGVEGNFATGNIFGRRSPRSESIIQSLS